MQNQRLPLPSGVPQLILLCCLLLTAARVSAQPVGAANGSPEEDPSLLRDLKQNAIHSLWRMPTLELIGIMAATPSVMHRETNRPYVGWIDHPRVDHTFEFGSPLGNGMVEFGGSLTTYFAGKALHKPGLAVLGSDLFSSQLIAATLSTGLKVATHRTRPDGAPYSFPSGHATLAFSAAGVIAGHYGTVAGIFAEGAATYVGLSRLQENKHYISDVVAGCLLGNYVAYTVVHRRALMSRISVTTVPLDEVHGLELSLKF